MSSSSSNPYSSKSHQTVYNKGRAARFDGKPRHNPYPDYRGGRHGNCVTGSRGYLKAWYAGYDSVTEAELKEHAREMRNY